MPNGWVYIDPAVGKLFTKAHKLLVELINIKYSKIKAIKLFFLVPPKEQTKKIKSS